jgi:hypothetical protein
MERKLERKVLLVLMELSYRANTEIKQSIDARRLHQGEQLVDSLLRRLPYQRRVRRAANSDLTKDSFNFVAKVRKKQQRVLRVIRNPCDKPRYQNLTSDHPPVEFVHRIFPIANGDEATGGDCSNSS